jgi:hypothetical protein
MPKPRSTTKPRKSIRRCSALVYPRYVSTLRGKQKTQYYDAKWRREVNAVTADPRRMMVVVGLSPEQRYANATKAEIQMLLDAKRKLGNRFIVLDEKKIKHLRKILERRGLAIDPKLLEVTGMGQHYTSQNPGTFCVLRLSSAIGKELAHKGRFSVEIDKKKSMQWPRNKIEDILIKAKLISGPITSNYGVLEGPRTAARKDQVLLETAQFIIHGLIKYSRIARFAKKSRNMKEFRQQVIVEVRNRLLNREFNSRLSRDELIQILSFISNRPGLARARQSLEQFYLYS